jgi:hypothetical protein
VFEREDPFIKLALDVLGACSVCVGMENYINPSLRQNKVLILVIPQHTKSVKMMAIVLWTQKSRIPEYINQAREKSLSSNYPGSFHISSPHMP